MILGDFGAEVLRVEEPPGSPRHRAEEAAWGVRSVQEARRWAAFNPLNRNKRSIALNLKHPEGRRILHQLCKEADIFVEQFRPGVVQRLGCDYETLSRLNPRLIYCSISGYGQEGPYRNLVGHDINYISLGGALGLVGPKGGEPVIPYNIIADYAAGGLQAVVGILIALLAREKTGRGQYVDMAMLDGVIYLLAVVFAEYFAQGVVPRRGEMRLNGGVPYYNVYECKDGEYISLGCIESPFWQNLCRALGREDFIPSQHDADAYPDIFAAFRRIFKTRTRDEWWEYLYSLGDIAVGKVYRLDEVIQDPQVRERKMVLEVGQLDGEIVRQVGIGPKLAETPGEVRSLGVPTGAHTDEVLRSLGYTPEQLKRLREEGVIA